MKIRYVTLLAAIAGLMAACGNDRKAGMQPDPSLKEAASGKFLMGVALNVRQAAGQDTCASKVVKRHFNSIVAENCMKCEVIHPEEDHFDFTEADRLVKTAECTVIDVGIGSAEQLGHGRVVLKAVDVLLHVGSKDTQEVVKH